MIEYIIRRLAVGVFVVFIATIVVFAIIHLAPGSPVYNLVPENAPPELIEATKDRLGLNEPLPVQYFKWLGNLLTGDLGISIVSRHDVASIISERIKVTLSMTLSALIISYVIAIPLGIISAIKQDSYIDHFIRIFAVLGVSIPSFWFGILLITIFSIYLGWLPTSGAGGIKYLVLPVSALTYIYIAMTVRVTRSSMLEVLRQDYIRTAFSKGLSTTVTYYKHALRNALIPLISMLGLRIGWLIASGVVIEIVFARPGLGRSLVEAIYQRDYPVLQVIMLLLVTGIVLGNLLADVLYGVVDPRIRYD